MDIKKLIKNTISFLTQVKKIEPVPLDLLSNDKIYFHAMQTFGYNADITILVGSDFFNFGLTPQKNSSDEFFLYFSHNEHKYQMKESSDSGVIKKLYKKHSIDLIGAQDIYKDIAVKVFALYKGLYNLNSEVDKNEKITELINSSKFEKEFYIYLKNILTHKPNLVKSIEEQMSKAEKMELEEQISNTKPVLGKNKTSKI